jgi:predicted Zn finger-like uncharacterized protein
MYTCCPHCQTCFRITKPQLDVAQGKVRCGHCQQVFNARQYLHAELPASAATAANTGSPASTAAEAPAPADTEQPPDFDLFDLDSIPESKEEESWIEDLAPESESPEDEEPTSVLDVSELARTLAEQDEDEDEDDILAGLDDEEEEEDDILAAMDDEEYNGDVLEGLDDDDEEEDATSIIEMRPLQHEDLIPGDVIPVEETADAENGVSASRDTTADDEEDTSSQSSQYLYVDPEDLRKEDKQIEEIMAEMDAQLNQSTEMETSMDSLFADGEPDAEEDAAPAAASPGQADDFEESFLGNLDAGLAMTPPVSEPEPPAPHAAATGEPARPATTTTDSGIQPAPVQTDAFDDILTEPTTRAGFGPGGHLSDSTEIPARLRDSFVTEAAPRRPLRKLAGALLLLILAGALFIQLIMFRSTALLSAVPALQPLVERACQQLPCLYTGPVDVSRIKLVSRDIRVHPREKNALLISATFVNRAPFAQPYPKLTITLSDLGGEIVARRQFTPAEYLGRPVSIFQLLPPGKPVQLALEVVDPGKDAVNFEFTFQ